MTKTGRVAGGKQSRAHPAVPGGSLRPVFAESVQRDRGVGERTARAHLGRDPDGFHDLLVAHTRPAGELGVAPDAVRASGATAPRPARPAAERGTGRLRL